MKFLQVLMALAVATTSLFASSFVISVDTSSLVAGASGFLDIQFNGGGVPTPPGTATVTQFTGTTLL